MEIESKPDADLHVRARSFAEAYGIAPFFAVGLAFGDTALYCTLELPSFEALAFVSAGVGALLVIPGALLQRYSYGDNWGTAWGKALICGILFAIPTPMASLFTLGLGALGVVGMAEKRAAQRNGRTTAPTNP